MYVNLFPADKITYKYRFNQIYCDLLCFSLQNYKNAIIKHLKCTFNAFVYYIDSLIYKRFKSLSLRKKRNSFEFLFSIIFTTDHKPTCISRFSNIWIFGIYLHIVKKISNAEFSELFDNLVIQKIIHETH